MFIAEIRTDFYHWGTISCHPRFAIESQNPRCMQTGCMTRHINKVRYLREKCIFSQISNFSLIYPNFPPIFSLSAHFFATFPKVIENYVEITLEVTFTLVEKNWHQSEKMRGKYGKVREKLETIWEKVLFFAKSMFFFVFLPGGAKCTIFNAIKLPPRDAKAISISKCSNYPENNSRPEATE